MPVFVELISYTFSLSFVVSCNSAYQLSNEHYFGECQECGISDTGVQPQKIIEKIEDLIWKKSQNFDIECEF